MLLRSISKHVRDQNWFAVGLDFFIVVFGVFIGLQVQQWNEGRVTRIEEHRILERLHSEIQELVSIVEEGALEPRERRALLFDLRPLLFSQIPARPLSEKECKAIGLSHIRPNLPDTLSTLEEMVANGRVDLISSEALRMQLRQFLLYREQARLWYAEGSNDLFRLGHLYPSDIKLRVRAMSEGKSVEDELTSGHGYSVNFECRLETLKLNQGLLNDYIDNLARLTVALHTHDEGMTVRLTLIQATLEETLGIASTPTEEEVK